MFRKKSFGFRQKLVNTEFGFNHILAETEVGINQKLAETEIYLNPERDSRPYLFSKKVPIVVTFFAAVSLYTVERFEDECGKRI